MTSRILMTMSGLGCIVLQRDGAAIFIGLVLVAYEIAGIRRDP